MKITLLGTGTSQGVPVIACECDACLSSDKRDHRLRCSVSIQTEDVNIIIDVGPDFRQQILSYGPKKLDAILITHEHNDHVAGIDDLRPFIFRQKKNMPIFAQRKVLEDIKVRYPYAFGKNQYPGIPKFDLIPIEDNPFNIGDITIIPINVMHGKLPILGFRIGGFTYITDALWIEEREKIKIRGSEILVINALQRGKHYSHLNLKEALELIDDLSPQKAYLTHISHKMGRTGDWEKELPPNVFPAFDGLEFNL